MVIKVNKKFGDSLYIINDPNQLEYILVGIICRPGSISYELSYLGEIIELYDFEVSDTKDVLRTLLDDKNEEN